LLTFCIFTVLADDVESHALAKQSASSDTTVPPKLALLSLRFCGSHSLNCKFTEVKMSRSDSTTEPPKLALLSRGVFLQTVSLQQKGAATCHESRMFGIASMAVIQLQVSWQAHKKKNEMQTRYTWATPK
jgi:hypothetical protein